MSSLIIEAYFTLSSLIGDSFFSFFFISIRRNWSTNALVTVLQCLPVNFLKMIDAKFWQFEVKRLYRLFSWLVSQMTRSKYLIDLQLPWVLLSSSTGSSLFVSFFSGSYSFLVTSFLFRDCWRTIYVPFFSRDHQVSLEFDLFLVLKTTKAWIATFDLKVIPGRGFL